MFKSILCSALLLVLAANLHADASTIFRPAFLTSPNDSTAPIGQPAGPKTPASRPSDDEHITLIVAEDFGSDDSVVTKTGGLHAGWDSLLQQYVSETGQVNYKGLKASPDALAAYCRSLAENTPQENWSRDEKLAYWINAYNAFTMKLIVDNYPTASILRFDGGKTWDVKRISLGGKKYSLNQIENEIIRPQFKEPRIHFAINCAAKSCPPLYNRAFTAENLEGNLEGRAKLFINNSRYNTISATKASVSKIFDWYGADFGDLKKYLNRYAATPLRPSATVIFNDYDWDLNE